jgi:ring-1,2-phenylacetyl-CoA epoxidase subunit PaaE
MDQNFALEDWELERGFILACQAHPTTPEIELDYDER